MGKNLGRQWENITKERRLDVKEAKEKIASHMRTLKCDNNMTYKREIQQEGD